MLLFSILCFLPLASLAMTSTIFGAAIQANGHPSPSSCHRWRNYSGYLLQKASDNMWDKYRDKTQKGRKTQVFKLLSGPSFSCWSSWEIHSRSLQHGCEWTKVLHMGTSFSENCESYLQQLEGAAEENVVVCWLQVKKMHVAQHEVLCAMVSNCSV